MHGGGPLAEPFDHCPPGWIRQSRKCRIQSIHNQMVVDYLSLSSVNSAVPGIKALGMGLCLRKPALDRSQLCVTRAIMRPSRLLMYLCSLLSVLCSLFSALCSLLIQQPQLSLLQNQQNEHIQQTADCQKPNCLTPRVHPKMSSPAMSDHRLNR